MTKGKRDALRAAWQTMSLEERSALARRLTDREWWRVFPPPPRRPGESNECHLPYETTDYGDGG